MENRTSRRDLLRRIRVHSHAALEHVLFLGDHIGSRESVNALQDALEKLSAARSLYERRYGPDEQTAACPAEQQICAAYDSLIRLADDPDLKDALRILRQRERIHARLSGELLRILQEHAPEGNGPARNPGAEPPRARRVLNGNTGEYRSAEPPWRQEGDSPLRRPDVPERGGERTPGERTWDYACVERPFDDGL